MTGSNVALARDWGAYCCTTRVAEGTGADWDGTEYDGCIEGVVEIVFGMEMRCTLLVVIAEDR
jgi:hypothetical protein